MAPFYNGADLRICVEKSGVLEDSKDVSACVEKDNKNCTKTWTHQKSLRI